MVKVNGENLELDGTKLSDFLKSANYDMSKIAVEINGQIVPKVNYGETILKDQDTVEVVSFVGGG